MLVENKILPKEITELFNDVIDGSYQKITSKEKKIIHEEISGNFDETENEYNVIVYYRNYGERFDRVVGVGKGLSQFITN